MDFQQNLLKVAEEECAEVAQALSKAIRFGLKDKWPGKKSGDNTEEIIKEFNDLLAVMGMLAWNGSFGPNIKSAADMIDHAHCQTKVAKVLHYTLYSQSKGCVDLTIPELHKIQAAISHYENSLQAKADQPTTGTGDPAPPAAQD